MFLHDTVIFRMRSLRRCESNGKKHCNGVTEGRARQLWPATGGYKMHLDRCPRSASPALSVTRSDSTFLIIITPLSLCAVLHFYHNLNSLAAIASSLCKFSLLLLHHPLSTNAIPRVEEKSNLLRALDQSLNALSVLDILKRFLRIPKLHFPADELLDTDFPLLDQINRKLIVA